MNIVTFSFRIEVVNKKLVTPDGVEEKMYIMELEIKLAQSLDLIFIELASIEDSQKRLDLTIEIGNYLIEIIKQNMNLYKVNKEMVDKSRTTFIGFYRVFSLFIKTMIEHPDFASIEKLFCDTLKMNKKDLQNIMEHCFDVCLRTFAFIKDNEKRSFDIASTLFDLFCHTYRRPECKFLDQDLFMM